MANNQSQDNSDNKRKDRERTGSSTSTFSSPSDKRHRNSSQYSSDDEVMDALKMVESYGDNMREIISKLDKLDVIDSKLSSIERKMSALESKVTCIQQQHKETEGDVKELTKSASFLTSEVEQIKLQQKNSGTEVNDEVNTLKRQILYQNCYTRRENLNFFGLKENDGENVQQVIRDFLREILKLSDAQEVEFQRIHRSGRPRTDGSTRPIIVRFLRFTDRERIFRLGINTLKGTRYKILEDFPKDIIESRRRLIPLLKQTKSEGRRVFLQTDAR